MRYSNKNIDQLWPPTFEGAIFDFDGTLADSGWIWDQVDKEFFDKRNIVMTEEFTHMISILGFDDGAAYTIEAFNLKDETVEGICQEWNDSACRLYREGVHYRPGALEYMNKLKEAGIPISLATTNDPNVVHQTDHRLDIPSFFDAETFGNEVAGGKDTPDIYALAAQRIGVHPSNCIVFEDLPVGLKAAGSLGMKTVGLPTSELAQNKRALIEHSHIILNDWRDIIY